MSHTQEIPTAPARLVSPQAQGDPWTFRATCPYCPRVHIHGAGHSATDAHAHYGPRVAHCTDIVQRGRRVFDASPFRGRSYCLVPAVAA